ncbi:MAG TPA: hypothetical protein VFL64_09265 [Rhizobacter sp.]|nr:hypothetical protein [Rhizobacter sp.]
MRFLLVVLAASALLAALPARSQTTDPAVASSPGGAEPTVVIPPAEPGKGIWRLMASPYSFHYSQDPEHRPVWMVGLEHQFSTGYLWGATYFSNSFGQPSGFVYGGQRLSNWSVYDQLFAQWTAGILYGYKGEYKDKVPFNHGGFSPGVVLAVGWQFTPMYSAQLNVLGNSALMFQVSVDFR